MKKLRKRNWLLLAGGLFIAVASVAIPVGVVFGTKKAESVPVSIVAIDKTEQSQVITWGEDPSLIAAPELNAFSVSNPQDYEPGKFEATSLTPSTVPGAKAATITFSYSPKSASVPTLRVTYSLDVLKATPAKTFPENLAVTAPGQEWSVALGSPMQDAVNEKKISEYLKTNGYTGYEWSPRSVSYYSDAAAQNVLDEAGFNALKLSESFYVRISVDLDTVHYFDSSTQQNEQGGSVTTDYSLTGILTAKVVVKMKAIPPKPEELFEGPKKHEYSRSPVLDSPTHLGTGYGFDKRESLVVTAQRSPIKNVNTLPVGFKTGDVDNTQFRKLNAGTEYQINVLYKPLSDYAGEKITYVMKYVIEKYREDITVPYWNDWDVSGVDETSYKQGSDPLPVMLVPATYGAGATKVYLDSVTYYLNRFAIGSPVNKEEIMNLAQGELFSVVLAYPASPNYEFVGDPDRTVYKVTRHFRVADPK